MTRIRIAAVLLLLTSGVLAADRAVAQGYPAKAIRLVVPFGPGGSNDIVGRIVAQKLGERAGQAVIVENRPGAGGVTGTDSVVNAAPDGYTLMIGATSTIAANAGLYPKRGFDPVKNLTPISQIASSALLMAVPASLPAHNVREFIELAKARAGQLNYGTSGKGSSMHLLGEMLNTMAAVKIVHVPYKSGGAAIADLAVDRVQLLYSDLSALLPFVRSGQVRALAVTTPKRSPLLPDLPTVSESGVPGFEATNWYGILGPARLPRDIVMRLNGDLAHIMHSPDMVERLKTLGIEPLTGTPEAFVSFIQAEVLKWSQVVKMSGAELE
ncbi:MAG: tripartite tricarboxylate transporter substrate binding protein [Betaproteobacteria bacterium]|nr:tripartite tricarboxylate transporter substrate binding protein [Betaproteobacteria bacterium]